MTQNNLEARLRAIGHDRYHHRHPFHGLMRDGALSKAQVQAWALNRYYYQSVIPLKDAAILARATDVDLRRAWRQRLVDQDGEAGAPGGLDRWLALAKGLDLDPDYVRSTDGVLPGVRFAADAYVQFVRESSLLEAVASSLTELFAPAIIAERTSAMLAHYPFVRRESLAYFDVRLDQAPRDASFALAWVERRATKPELAQLACQAVTFKCEVLWAILDAVHHAYVSGHPPPGAFAPDREADSATT